MNSCCKIAKTVWLTLLFVLVQTTALKAQGIGDDEPKDSWVTSYALIILAVGLGLFVICRPGKRSKKVKAEGE